MMLPLDAIGLAPNMRKYWVRSMSGIGKQELMAVQLPGHELVWQLVDRGGREPVSGTQEAREWSAVRDRSEAVHIRVAEIDADGVASVLALADAD